MCISQDLLNGFESCINVLQVFESGGSGKDKGEILPKMDYAVFHLVSVKAEDTVVF